MRNYQKTCIKLCFIQAVIRTHCEVCLCVRACEGFEVLDIITIFAFLESAHLISLLQRHYINAPIAKINSTISNIDNN